MLKAKPMAPKMLRCAIYARVSTEHGLAVAVAANRSPRTNSLLSEKFNGNYTKNGSDADRTSKRGIESMDCWTIP
jgi:hypothetical protein